MTLPLNILIEQNLLSLMSVDINRLRTLSEEQEEEVFLQSILPTFLTIRVELFTARKRMRIHSRCYRGYRTALMRYAKGLKRWQVIVRR